MPMDNWTDFIIHRYFKTTRRISLKYVATYVIILAVLTSQVSGSCRRRFSVETIHYKDCRPKRLLTYSCVGTCSTHAQISTSYPFDITRTCYQCKETDVQDRRVKIKCPSTEGPLLFKDIFIHVQVPKRCMCQICNVNSHSQTETDTVSNTVKETLKNAEVSRTTVTV